MPAERGGATPRNGQQHFHVLPTDPLKASFDESASRSADQIGHLERWPVHQRVRRTNGRVQVTLREMQIEGDLFEITMA